MAQKNYEHSDNSSISLKETFMKHFFYAMDDLRETWKDKQNLNQKEFNLDILYLISLIPNEKRQEHVLKKWSDAQDEHYKIKENEHLSREEVVAYSGFAAITEIVKFLCESFELATEDITGPGTSAEYVDIVDPMDLPDMANPDKKPGKPDVGEQS